MIGSSFGSEAGSVAEGWALVFVSVRARQNVEMGQLSVVEAFRKKMNRLAERKGRTVSSRDAWGPERGFGRAWTDQGGAPACVVKEKSCSEAEMVCTGSSSPDIHITIGAALVFACKPVCCYHNLCKKNLGK